GIPGPEFKAEYATNPDQYLRDAIGNRRYIQPYPNLQGNQQQPTANQAPAQNQNANQNYPNFSQNDIGSMVGLNGETYDQSGLSQLNTQSPVPENQNNSQISGQNEEQGNGIGGASLANQQRQLSWNG